MKNLVEDLKEVLEKHNAEIFVEQEENESFLYLQLRIGDDERISLDSGYRDLSINTHNLGLVLNNL